MTRRYSISQKLILSYLLIALVALSVGGVLFYALVKQAITDEAFNTLEFEAQTFLNTVDVDVDPTNPQQALLAKKTSRLRMQYATRTMSIAVVIVNQKNGKVESTNVEGLEVGDKFPVSLANIDTEQNSTYQTVKQVGQHEYLIHAMPLPEPQYQGLDAVFLTPLENVSLVIKDLIGALIKGFLITSVVVLVLGLWLSRSLTKPIRVLQEQMKRLAKRDFSPPPVVTTGDELEEVSRSFAAMVEELKRYDQGQRRFLQNASHELKTPLMAIQGYAEGILDGIFAGEEASTGLDVISQESVRLKKLVDELIYLSKLETLEDIYAPTEQECTELVEDSVARVHSLALQKGIGIAVQGRGMYLIHVDRDKMMQAFINLLSNGVRHANSRLEVRLSRVDDHVRIAFHDDGEGFANQTEQQPQIFERFYKGDKGDTGLGLAIVKAIVEKSGGSIAAHNHAQGGAEIVLQLPIHP
ncbi:sensor histidine kinase [Tumebacillus permanentifrigoris]|uniref:histidine kinase n=1 Tax=Tumebacillus permanentifrigoris TaxID=378543 RepID=A0A316DC06_9BACL|nr:HAMP domain-containing sensor histidine kinase [Tumebacillus permanentifrigoris]PWK13763.1 signal transduction histidine kinase [Tumebacillus permanentifrigoris]